MVKWFFISSGRAACLEDVPAEAEFDINTTALIGLNFSADEQCRALHGPTETHNVSVRKYAHVCGVSLVDG